MIRGQVCGFKTGPTLRTTSYDRALAKHKKKQAKYNCNDGLCVWEKEGIRDYFLYYMTWMGCGVGLVGWFSMMYSMAKPPSWKNKK